jgi:hypothetical protein
MFRITPMPLGFLRNARERRRLIGGCFSYLQVGLNPATRFLRLPVLINRFI